MTSDTASVPEVEVSRDLIKRGLIVAPLIIAVCGVIWGGDGAWSAAYGIAIVLANFALSAALIASAARISLHWLMGATLFGYILRLGLIFLAVWVVKDAELDFAPGARSDDHRHAPRPPGLGAQVRGDLVGLPGPQTDHPTDVRHPREELR